MRKPVRLLLIGCGVLLFLTLGMGFAGLRWLNATFNRPQPAAPVLAGHAALRPIFLPRQGEPIAAGTACVVRKAPGSRPVILTALHLLGPSGGMEKQLGAADARAQVAGVALLPFGASEKTRPIVVGRRALREDNNLPDPEVRTLKDDWITFDATLGKGVEVLNLAGKSPAAGEWVWLVGDSYQSNPEKQRLWAAQVIFSEAKELLVRIKDPVNLSGFSGAPVINQQKEVVGILIAGGPRTGRINPVANFRAGLP